MKKRIYLSLVLSFVALCSYACTTFFINKNGKMVFGRNYDWVTGSGMIVANLRGLHKTSFPMLEGKTINWISRYGSITFNQYGKEFPTGGMNEKGLVVELMWLDNTKYPAPDQRPAISVLQWIQYQLDNCATIEEVIETDKILRIATVGTTPLHYLVADRNGNAATIEFLDGNLKVHRGDALIFPVLANDTYQESLGYINSTSSLSESYSSGSRFVRACSMIRSYNGAKTKIPAVDYSFNILDEVSQGDFTKWSIVYDLTDLKIYFKTSEQPQRKFLSFSSFNFGCAERALFFDLRTVATGEIANRFLPVTSQLHFNIISKSFDDSRSRIHVASPYIQKIIEYQAEIRCK